MNATQTIRLTLALVDAQLDLEERDKQASRLLLELRELDIIESASRVTDSDPPPMSKSVGSYIVGLLTAEISFKNAQSAFRFLGSRLSGKPIELEVEAHGKRLKVTANNTAELKDAIAAAQDFISR